MTIDNAPMFFAATGQWPADFAANGWSVQAIMQALDAHGKVSDVLVDDLAAYLEREGFPMRPTPPAGQVSSVLAALLDLVDGPAIPGRMDAIRATAHQLADLWQAYQAGELRPLPNDPGVPF